MKRIQKIEVFFGFLETFENTRILPLCTRTRSKVPPSFSFSSFSSFSFLALILFFLHFLHFLLNVGNGGRVGGRIKDQEKKKNITKKRTKPFSLFLFWENTQTKQKKPEENGQTKKGKTKNKEKQNILAERITKTRCLSFFLFLWF